MVITNKQIRADTSLNKIIDEVVSHHLKRTGKRVPVHLITRKIAKLIEEKHLKKELLNEFVRF